MWGQGGDQANPDDRFKITPTLRQCLENQVPRSPSDRYKGVLDAIHQVLCILKCLRLKSKQVLQVSTVIQDPDEPVVTVEKVSPLSHCSHGVGGLPSFFNHAFAQTHTGISQLLPQLPSHPSHLLPLCLLPFPKGRVRGGCRKVSVSQMGQSCCENKTKYLYLINQGRSKCQLLFWCIARSLENLAQTAHFVSPSFVNMRSSFPLPQ